MVDYTTLSADRGALGARAANHPFRLSVSAQIALLCSLLGRTSPKSCSFARPVFLLGFPLIIALIAGGVCRSVSAQEAPATGLEMASAIEQSLVQTIAKCEKSVVAIWRVNPTSQGTSPAIPAPGVEFLPLRYGTGVVIDAKGLILTQYQLLDEKDVHWVTTSDRITREAKILAADPRSGLAVLEIKADDLSPIAFGDAETLKKGQIVVTLGNPQAIARDGQVSASWGIVSNIGRKAGSSYLDVNQLIDKPRWQRPTLHHYGTLIQTDTRLNLGSSGSALVNLQGQMVGLTTSVASTPGHEPSAEYAVPINQDMRRIIEELKAGREVEYGILGVQPRTMPFSPTNPTQVRGVIVNEVILGGPAYVAGLKKEDIITHVNDEQITDSDRLMLRLGLFPVGSKISLSYLRGDKKRQTSAVLSKLKVPGHKIYTKRESPWRGMDVDYATATSDLLNLSKNGLLDPKGCVLVKEVAKESPAWREGIRSDTFISHVEGRRVATPADFRNAVASKSGPVRIRLTGASAKKAERIIKPAK